MGNLKAGALCTLPPHSSSGSAHYNLASLWGQIYNKKHSGAPVLVLSLLVPDTGHGMVQNLECPALGARESFIQKEGRPLCLKIVWVCLSLTKVQVEHFDWVGRGCEPLVVPQAGISNTDARKLPSPGTDYGPSSCKWFSSQNVLQHKQDLSLQQHLMIHQKVPKSIVISSSHSGLNESNILKPKESMQVYRDTSDFQTLKILPGALRYKDILSEINHLTKNLSP